MKILITGATGFVGRRLCSQLKAHCRDGDGLELIGLGRTPNQSLSGVLDHFIQADLSEQVDLDRHLEGVDIVIHLASRVHVMQETSDHPLEAFRKANRDASQRLAEAAARSGVSHFVFLSSIKVNGEETTDSPFSVHTPPQPLDPYGISKFEAEQAILKVASASSMTATVLRPPLVYGPGVRANFLSLLKATQRGIPLPLGMVHNRRHLIFLDNLCDAIIHTALRTKPKSGVYLVADDEAVSTTELLRQSAKFMDRSPRLVPVPIGMLRTGGRLLGMTAQISRLTGNLEVDNSYFKSETGWHPPFSFREGLRETCEWFNRRSLKSESSS